MKKFIPFLFLVVGLVFVVWGCMGNHGAPVSPTRVISLSVTASNLNDVRAQLLGASQNVILYRVDEASGSSVTGSVGPFSTSGDSGSYTFTIPNFIANGSSVLSLQLNDASTNQALAIGAAPMASASGVAVVNVALGSVVRACYDISGDSTNLAYGYSFSFVSDDVDPSGGSGGGLDINFYSSDGETYDMWDASSDNDDTPDIAYLGNGNLVDFDRVPPDSAFSYISYDAKGGDYESASYADGLRRGGHPRAQAPHGAMAQGLVRAKAASGPNYALQKGDIFCVKAQSIPGAHAWIQVTDPGIPGTSGPSFCYRVNNGSPYYAYQPTAFDRLGGCSGPVTGGAASASLDFDLDYSGPGTVDDTHQMVALLASGFQDAAPSFLVLPQNPVSAGFGGLPPGNYFVGFVYGSQGVPYSSIGNFKPHVGDTYSFDSPSGTPLCFASLPATGNMPLTVGETNLGSVTFNGACTFTGLTGNVSYSGALGTINGETQAYVACYPTNAYTGSLSMDAYSTAGRYDSPDLERSATVTKYYVVAWFDAVGYGATDGPQSGDPVTQFGPLASGRIHKVNVNLSDSNIFVFTPTVTTTPTITTIPTVTTTPGITATPIVTATPVAPYASFTAKDTYNSASYGNGGIAVNSAGTTVYLSYNFQSSDDYDPSVQVWGSADGVTYSAATTWTVSGGCPQGLAVDSSGNVYVADSCQNEVEKYSSAGVESSSIGYNTNSNAFPGLLYAPTGVAVDSSGNIFVGENVSNYAVQTFNSAGTAVTYWAGTGYDPAVAVSSSGATVYEAPTEAGSNIYVFSNSGASLGTFGSDAGTFSAGGIAMASSGPYAGNIYVTDTANSRVMEFNSSDTFVGSWGENGTGSGQFEEPSGIAVDGSGYIYVADFSAGMVQKFAPR